MCCCNPEKTVSTPFTSIVEMQKEFRPGCGPCCRKSNVTVTLSSNNAQAGGHKIRSIKMFPDDVDKVYLAINDTWEKQKMLMAGVFRNA